MADDFETKIRELYEKAFSIWNSDEFPNYPLKESIHLMAVIYLKNTYDQLHLFESEGPNCEGMIHSNQITAIGAGLFPNYGDLGISSDEATKLGPELTNANRRSNPEKYHSALRRVIEVERRIFELTE